MELRLGLGIECSTAPGMSPDNVIAWNDSVTEVQLSNFRSYPADTDPGCDHRVSNVGQELERAVLYRVVKRVQPSDRDWCYIPGLLRACEIRLPSDFSLFWASESCFHPNPTPS